MLHHRSYIKRFEDAFCPCLEFVVGFGEGYHKTPKTQNISSKTTLQNVVRYYATDTSQEQPPSDVKQHTISLSHTD